MEKESFSIEEGFSRINELIGKMEDPELGLAESMSLYKEGVALLKRCNEELDRTEKEMITIQEETIHVIHSGENPPAGEGN